MSVKWNKTGKTTGELTFDISQNEVKLGLDQAFRRVKKELTCTRLQKRSRFSCYLRSILW